MGRFSLPLYSPYHPSIRFVLLRVPNKEVKTGPDLQVSFGPLTDQSAYLFSRPSRDTAFGL
jgi:hypothetical protein